MRCERSCMRHLDTALAVGQACSGLVGLRWPRSAPPPDRNALRRTYSDAKSRTQSTVIRVRQCPGAQSVTRARRAAAGPRGPEPNLEPAESPLPRTATTESETHRGRRPGRLVFAKIRFSRTNYSVLGCAHVLTHTDPQAQAQWNVHRTRLPLYTVDSRTRVVDTRRRRWVCQHSKEE